LAVSQKKDEKVWPSTNANCGSSPDSAHWDNKLHPLTSQWHGTDGRHKMTLPVSKYLLTGVDLCRRQLFS